MATSKKPIRTGSKHTLPFEKLGPGEFERLCLWLAKREKFERVEHLGEAGSEGGRDVVGWKCGRRWVFQCKRVQVFSLSHAKKEIAKLRALPREKQPDDLVFVVSRAVGLEARDAIRAVWGDEGTCHFWSGNELDEKVKRHPALLAEFFELPPDTSRVGRVISLPYASLGELFQGREEILAALHQKLTEKKTVQATAIAVKAVLGLGGVGKTRLAIEYAWRYAMEYSAVLFVRAGTPSDLQGNFAALCEPVALDLPERNATEEDVQVAAVLRRLAGQPGWLLILDNIDSKEAANAVAGLMAQLQGGQVLLTGRLAPWGAEVERILLNVLTKQAAADFLLARTQSQRRPTPDEAAQANALAHELGYLPLALEQAGAYIGERGLTIFRYLEEWRSRHEQVLTWFDPNVSHYPTSVAATWQTSVDQLGAPARRLLERLAWLGPEPIPESLLGVPVPDLPEGEIDPDPPAPLAELANYSLATRAADAPIFSIHRLVQDVTRRSLLGDLGKTRLAEALRWVNGAFKGDPADVRTWPVLRPLSSHAQVVCSFAAAAGMTDPTARLMNELAQLLKATNRFREAEPLMRRVVDILESSPDGMHPNLAKSLNNLALLLQAMNRIREAEPLMRRALSIEEASFGAEHPNVARDLNNLAQLLKETSRLKEAEPLMRRALSIDEASFGTDHPDVARDLNNLAQLLQDTNRLGEAEPLMRRALSIDEACFGANHPNVAIRLNNLATLLQETNRLGEAEPLVRRALSIDEASFGADHPDVARDLHNLAWLLKATNHLGEAEPLMARAVKIFETSLGENHPHLAIALHNLARLYQTTNRLREAEPLMRRALEIVLEFERRNGFEHPHRKAISANYRALLQEMGKSPSEIEEAMAELEASLH